MNCRTMYMFTILFVFSLCSPLAEARAPRKRLETHEDIIQFLDNVIMSDSLLGFFDQDEEGNILNRDNPEGPWAKFIQIDRKNPSIALGIVVSSELKDHFGVLPGNHFVQVKQAEHRFELRQARFYSDFSAIPSQPGNLVARVTLGIPQPMCDKHADPEKLEERHKRATQRQEGGKAVI